MSFRILFLIVSVSADPLTCDGVKSSYRGECCSETGTKPSSLTQCPGTLPVYFTKTALGVQSRLPYIDEFLEPFKANYVFDARGDGQMADALNVYGANTAVYKDVATMQVAYHFDMLYECDLGDITSALDFFRSHTPENNATFSLPMDTPGYKPGICGTYAPIAEAYGYNPWYYWTWFWPKTAIHTMEIVNAPSTISADERTFLHRFKNASEILHQWVSQHPLGDLSPPPGFVASSRVYEYDPTLSVSPC